MTKLTTIVAAVDLSETSKEVLRWAAVLTDRFHASLKVVHVIHDLKSYMGFYLAAKPIDALQKELEVEAQEKLMWLARDHLGEQHKHEIVILKGQPSLALVNYLKEMAADLVVVGCHGHVKPEHKILGSTAERLLKISPCPVVTVGQELIAHP